MSIFDDYEKIISNNEGLRLKPYKCTAGKLTIGYGRNIEDNGIREDEAVYLLMNDIISLESELTEIFGHFIWQKMPNYLKIVCMDMIYNLGVNKFNQFKNMIAGIRVKDKKKIIEEIKNSGYYKQVKNRADRNIKIIETEKY